MISFDCSTGKLFEREFEILREILSFIISRHKVTQLRNNVRVTD